MSCRWWSRVVLVSLVAAGCGGPARPAVIASGAAAPPPSPPVVPTPASDFAAEARAAGWVFEPPPGFTAVAVRDNTDVAYDHAVASADGRAELRYALRPYPTDLEPGMRTRQFSSTFFFTAILNLIRGGDTGMASKAEPVPAAEFAADEATMTVVKWNAAEGPADAFGTGFVLAAVVYMHRDGLGDAYIFAMFRDPDALGLVTEATFHSLRFAPAATE